MNEFNTGGRVERETDQRVSSKGERERVYREVERTDDHHREYE